MLKILCLASLGFDTLHGTRVCFLASRRNSSPPLLVSKFNIMIIPYNELTLEALQALIEDFVTRDGTDYGQDEMRMQDKAAHLLALLKTGELSITFNEDTQSCGIVTREELSKRESGRD